MPGLASSGSSQMLMGACKSRWTRHEVRNLFGPGSRIESGRLISTGGLGCGLGRSKPRCRLGGGRSVCCAHSLGGEVGFSSIPDAIADIASGKFVVVLDDKDRENEGDLIIAGEKITTETMAFMVEHTSGLVCVGMEGADLDRLDLPLMVDSDRNKELMKTAFTVSVDLAYGVTTGISALDRSLTIRKLADPSSDRADFQRPGHIFPLRYQPGGVLVRPGHTEAAVDLSRLAGCHPAGVLCEIVDKRDGSMARTSYLLRFAQEHDLLCITIDDLVKYRIERDVQNGSTGVTPMPLGQDHLKAFC